MAVSTGSDILILVHKLAALGDNAVCAAHKVCSMLLQNGGKNVIGPATKCTRVYEKKRQFRNLRHTYGQHHDTTVSLAT